MIGTTAPTTLPAPSRPEERSENPPGFVVISAEWLSVRPPAGLTTKDAWKGEKRPRGPILRRFRDVTMVL